MHMNRGYEEDDKIMKRLGAVILWILILGTVLTANADDSNRVFVYRDGQKFWHSSGHNMVYDNGNREANIHMPRLIEKNSTNVYPAYCVDVNTEAVIDTAYERVNLEDGTYYNNQQARMIRSILNNGYWPPEKPTEDYALLTDMEKRINAWLKTEYPDKTLEVEDLTGAEAMTATQGAIWHFANQTTFKETGNVYSQTVLAYAAPTYMIIDAVTVNPLENEGSDKHRNNINYTYEYLINQEEADPSSIIWSFTGEQVILSRKWVRDGNNANDEGGDSGWKEFWEALLGGNFSQMLENLWKEPDWSEEDPDSGDFYYQTLVRFKLKGTRKNVKNLKLYATLYEGDHEGAKLLQTKTYSIEDYGSDPKLTPDSSGYYTVSFDFFAREELSGNPYVKLNLVGEQNIERGVYIYVPGEQPEDRELSQSMVGFSSGLNRINVSSNISFSLSSMQLHGRKYVDGLEPDASFQFALTDVTDEEHPRLISTAWNQSGSRFSFPAVHYTEPGVYCYEVTEVQVDGFIALDQSVYRVEVEVITDDDGNLVVKCPKITKNGQSASCIVFDNGRETFLTVQKAWDLSHFSDPKKGEALIPEKITVALYQEGVEIDRVELTEEMGWTYTWEELDTQKHYTVRELDNTGRFICKTQNVYNITMLTNTVLNTQSQPTTGDESRLMLWITLIALSTAAWCIVKRQHIRQ